MQIIISLFHEICKTVVCFTREQAVWFLEDGHLQSIYDIVVANTLTEFLNFKSACILDKEMYQVLGDLLNFQSITNLK